MLKASFAAIAVSALAASAFAGAAAHAAADPTEPAFRSLYKELVETNTTLSQGSCTLAAEQIATRLKAAGFADSDVHLLVDPQHPKEGSLVAVLPGKDPDAKALLLLAHIDVVEAKRSDWTRDPFVLVEEDGKFWARGVADDKAQAAIYADTMIRLKNAPKLKRTVKLALTCGEETSGAFNGAWWLAHNHRDLIDAEFALNEGGGGRLSADGKREQLVLQVGEKNYQDYEMVATNPGGHSSRPRPDNAIYQLAHALERIEGYSFPVHLNDTTAAFFTQTAATAAPAMGAAMKALVANPQDKAANATVSADLTYNSMLRTTCVATQVDAGHAQNALPQHAAANINCRIIPGETPETTLAALQKVAGPEVKISAKPRRNKPAIQPPLTPRVVNPAIAIAKKHFPGVPLVPTMSTGATDAPYLAEVGIPVYGVPGIFSEPEGGVHGLNERIGVQSVMDGRAYLFDLIKAYASE